jgi:hypothetical protein
MSNFEESTIVTATVSVSDTLIRNQSFKVIVVGKTSTNTEVCRV